MFLRNYSPTENFPLSSHFDIWKNMVSYLRLMPSRTAIFSFFTLQRKRNTINRIINYSWNEISWYYDKAVASTIQSSHFGQQINWSTNMWNQIHLWQLVCKTAACDLIIQTIIWIGNSTHYICALSLSLLK